MNEKIDVVKTVLCIILPNPIGKNEKLDLAIYFGKSEQHINYFYRLFEVFPELAENINPCDLPQEYAEQLAVNGLLVYLNGDIDQKDTGPSEGYFFLPEENEITQNQAKRLEIWKEELLKYNTIIHPCFCSSNRIEDLDNLSYEEQLQLLDEFIIKVKNEKSR